IREAKAVSLEAFEDIPLHEVKTARNYEPVQVDATMDDLIHMIINQNFVPVVDDKGIFIGIITRKSVMNYLLSK
ncbi:MAG: CBS domain-containing protein, partial [Bacilli bacterium]|nr:CBS domain-containing protein [Bacilli bacterium]